MVLRKLERRNYGGKSPVSIKYQNLHSFKEELILLCQSILKTRKITHLNGSAHFTIPSSSKNCTSIERIVDNSLLACEDEKSNTTSNTSSSKNIYLKYFHFYYCQL